MATNTPDKLPPGPELDALTAQRVFGWKNVHKHAGALIGKKQDKAGHWRTTKVPNYSTNPVNAYAIDERMKQLGRSEQYANELSRVTTAKKVPVEWASPDQRCRAAIKAARKLSAVKPRD
jgi:hypothetical protein